MNELGYSVSVPVDSNIIIEAIFEGLLLREQTGRNHRSIGTHLKLSQTKERRIFIKTGII